jgi:uncharacterized membrane protein YgdD (TMEM256/DUF423 family)
MSEKEQASKAFFALGSLSAGIAVAAGAFGAHALKHSLSAEMIQVFETGVRYHMYHSFALLATSWAISEAPPGKPSRLVAVGWLFVGGIVLFSGSLYLLSLTGLAWLGAVTPLGGATLLTAWGILAWTIWRKR